MPVESPCRPWVVLARKRYMHTSSSERPRELHWYHAAGMLFGDWGTSRLYVLGAAFLMSAHASFWYVMAMCVLVSMVGFAYTIICKHFPDGGGVYSAAKRRSPTLGVIGALLLIADYVITASLSAYVGFRYMLPDSVDSIWALYAAAVSILVIGAINVVGPRRAGQLAVIVAVLSAVCYLITGLACLPALGHAEIHLPTEPIGAQWHHFVNVILALSGVEAIANMTGVMAEPVAKNARKAILVVLIEVVVLNLIMAYAMNALPELLNVTPETIPAALREDIGDHMIKVLAEHHVGHGFAVVSSFLFGMLLLSAANTAIGDMVSIQYLMARDKELPSAFTKLNRFGMPWVGLIVATVVPAIVLLIVGNHTSMLEDLYAIGVIGAITINLMACGTNKALDLAAWERYSLLFMGVILGIVELTIAVDKPKALLFAGMVLGVGLLGRHFAQVARIAREAPPKPIEKNITESAVRLAIPASAPRLLVPTRGNSDLLKFSIRYAQQIKGAVFVLFVREVALTFRERGETIATEAMTLGTDTEAREIFAKAQKMCEDSGVPMMPLYAVSDSPAEIILDHAATLGVEAVIMGVSQRGALWKTLRGDLLQEVMKFLPKSIPMLVHA